MKKCVNCEKINKDSDKFCRNCGCYLKSNFYYIFINIMIVFFAIVIILIILLFIASYLI